MFWYIGGILAGFAIGYVVALSQNRKRRRYMKGLNDCRNCKHMDFMRSDGLVSCEEISTVWVMPKSCTRYEHIKDAEGGS